MTKMAIIVPTRGRPKQALELYESYMDTISDQRNAVLIFCVDEDDPERHAYEAMHSELKIRVMPPSGMMVGSLNSAAASFAAGFPILGFLGDDHRLRSKGWDRAVIQLMNGAGFAYGNDLLQGERLPTHIWVRSSIVKALGWMGLPTCKHLFIDNVWKDLGWYSQSLAYMPEIIVEHLHPLAGKADWDEGYKRVNADDIAQHDRDAYVHWREESMEFDVEVVKAAMRADG